MLIIKQKMIYRSDLRANPQILYIFGDNLMREGIGGQAKEMRGEPNAFGIATKRRPQHGHFADYMHDNQEDAWNAVNADFLALRKKCATVHDFSTDIGSHFTPYQAIIVPDDGIGTGLARLPDFAPKLLDHINSQIIKLRSI